MDQRHGFSFLLVVILLSVFAIAGYLFLANSGFDFINLPEKSSQISPNQQIKVQTPQVEQEMDLQNVLNLKFDKSTILRSKGMVAITFPKEAIVNLKPTYVKSRFANGNVVDVQVSDADVAIGDEKYFISNLRGWVGGGLPCDCTVTETTLQNPKHELRLILRTWTNNTGVQVLQPSDIIFPDFNWRNFYIHKGPITNSTAFDSDIFLGTFSNAEVKMWKNILENNFTRIN